MKQLFSLSLFVIILLITTTLSAKTKTSAHLKSSSQSKFHTTVKAKTEQITLDALKKEWASLFTTSRGTTCSINVNNPDVSESNDPSLNEDADSKESGWGIKQANQKWIQKWGFGPVAYFLDFLDPVFQKDFIVEVKNIVSSMNKISNADTEVYYDKFNLSFIAPKSNKLATDADFKALNPKFSKAVYDGSFNSNQLNIAIPMWAYYVSNDSADPAYEYIAKYDLNGDGRVSTSEMVLGTIWNNKRRENLYCYNCFYLIGRKLAAMFTYMDCQGKGYLTAEDLWEKAPNVIRDDNRWNIFKHGTNDNIRTSSVNDFIIKNGYTVDGAVTKDEFISGILLGFWNRVIEDNTIVENDSKSMKTLRWTGNGLIDQPAVDYIAQNKS